MYIYWFLFPKLRSSQSQFRFQFCFPFSVANQSRLARKSLSFKGSDWLCKRDWLNRIGFFFFWAVKRKRRQMTGSHGIATLYRFKKKYNGADHSFWTRCVSPKFFHFCNIYIYILILFWLKLEYSPFLLGCENGFNLFMVKYKMEFTLRLVVLNPWVVVLICSLSISPLTLCFLDVPKITNGST